MQTRKWQDQQGQDKYTTEVVLSGFEGTMQMLGGNQKNDSIPPEHISKPSGSGIMEGTPPVSSTPKLVTTFNDFDDIDILKIPDDVFTRFKLY